MAEQPLDPEILDEHLRTITAEGIQADRRQLLKDMCGQFADPREWIREYVVNGYDAGASRVWIDGSEQEAEETYTISVEDNGRGMDRKGVQDFLTVFRSVKSGDARQIVGCHGIGKLSVAAVDGQCGFYMITSTGKQCWRMRTGHLLDDTPIRLERVQASLPIAADGATGLRNAYSSGDLTLFNSQGPGAGQEGQVRLAGFTASPELCGGNGYCLVLDGATGGNNAFAMLALLAAYEHFHDTRYLDGARTIGRWMIGTLKDGSGTGYGGFYLGYPDEGISSKTLIRSKSTENNADIFGAL